MRRILLMAWRYVAYHKIKTAILILCLTITIVLPLTAHLLIDTYATSLMARARSTPRILGAKGNRFDLVLKALYFSEANVDSIPLSELHALREREMGQAIPLHLRYTARGYPLVGTTLDYMEFRRLTIAEGTHPLQLGQAVVGAGVADAIALAPGGHIFSDQKNLYDISKTYPLKLKVVGVLAPTDAPDDDAVFVDVKTAWIIDGISHGHQDVVRDANESIILRRDENNVATNASIVEYNEVTADNLESFHTHAPPEQLPLTAIIVLPTDRKAATLLTAPYNNSPLYRMLVPVDVVEELLNLVFRVQRFFDANFALIGVSTLLFLTLVILLSLRLRRREMETMYKIGCSRLTVFWLQTAELGIVLAMSLVLAGAVAGGAVAAAPQLVRLLSGTS
jgi:putative ABC transport system permease protein